ncbi:MAG: type II CAAX endopeptidase family protein [Candidatus Anstonellales archaeon]
MKGFILALLVISLVFFGASALFFKNLLLNVISLHSAFLLSALYAYYDADFKKLLGNLSLLKSTPTEAVLYGIGSLFLMLCIYFIGFFFLRLIGFDDSGAVSRFIQEMPIAILLIAVFIAPITEEIFFRRLMLEKIGLILSSILFTFFHISYGSIVELSGAFTLALVLGILAERKGIAPCIVAHMLYNLSSVIAIRVLFP